MMSMLHVIGFLFLCPALVAPSLRPDLVVGGKSTSSSGAQPLCVRKVSMQAYDGVVPLKDGSGRLLCWNRDGHVWLAAVDTTTTGSLVLRQLGGNALIDLGSSVNHDAAAAPARGLAGVAVDSSGRLFVSYYTNTKGGGGFLVVDQVSASWREHEANRGDAAQPTTTRVFSMALPADQSEPTGSLLGYYGGQILFRPTTTDPFLYLITGPAQSDGQLQANILRFRVGQGNITVTPMEAQLYASGLGIPRRCVFDADRPQDLYCNTNVQDEQEQVYLVSDTDAPSYSATSPTQSLLVAHQLPTPPSIVGGLLYRGDADTTLAGSYIYMDGSQFWWTVSSPASNYSATRNLQLSCSATSTSTCGGGGGGVTSFGEDEGNNALLLSTHGVYQVVGPSLCNAAAPPHQTTKTPMSATKLLKWVLGVALPLFVGLGGGAYVLYKKCSCFNRRIYVTTVEAINSNVNVFRRLHQGVQGERGRVC